MTEPRWAQDEPLLADLKAALAAGAPDQAAVEAGRAAFAWRTIDRELATLAHDSLMAETSGVRGGVTAPRSLVFEGAELSLELEVVGRRVTGQLVPGARADVVVRSPAGEVARATTDDDGWFGVDVDADGDVVVRLECTTADATLVSDWVTLYR